MRIPFIAGNWKMNKDLAGARALAAEVREALGGVTLACAGAKGAARGAVEVALCPPFPFLTAVLETVAGSGISVGAQNAHNEAKGAFTGEVSCAMVRSTGATTVILGHSERRQIFREEDRTINLKVRAALAAGLRPILCVGETLEEREAGRTLDVVSRQFSLGLESLSPEAVEPLTIAYEPVWAIGTGKNATPAQAEEVHAFIRGFLKDRFGGAVAEAMRIQYGGSVKGKNAAELLSEPDIDGALVGGASLDAKEFAAIVAAAVKKTV